MIQSICIKNVATYNNTDGVHIDTFKKINFIYGANGSGKTTISNFLKQPENSEFSDCSITWKDDIQLSTLVYNKKFREENFGQGVTPGVFTLGKATNEEISEINKLQEELNKIKEGGVEKKNTLVSLKKSKTELEKNFYSQCWDEILKKNEFLFKEAFKGFMGSKKAFAEKILHEFHSNKRFINNLDELKGKAQTIFGESLQKIDEIKIIDLDELITIESDPVWSKKIIGKSDVQIGELISYLNINDWVNEGRQFLRNDSNVCPFCQKNTINEAFREELENYFDESYKLDLSNIKNLSNQYIYKLEQLIFLLREIERSETESKNKKLDINSFKYNVDILDQKNILNKEILNKKIKEPSRSLDLTSIIGQLSAIKELIYSANIGIKSHNILVENFQSERNNLIEDIWRFLVDNNKDFINKFISENIKYDKGIEALNVILENYRNSYRSIDGKIKDKNKKFTNIQSSIDEINKILEFYGFSNFKIVPYDDKYYRIQRENGDNAANTLSEGEVTFITFLYFFQLTKGGISPEKANEDRILVIDDPISSLDSTILFIVSSLLKEIIKEVKNKPSIIKQIIILTHNVYFHKEVSFVDGRTKFPSETTFWILRKYNNSTEIIFYKNKNPIRGSYELLWDELKSQNDLSGITLQNILRRILETYFKTMGAHTDDALIDSFNNPQEKEVCRSLFCWINDGSHCMSDDLHVEHQEAHNKVFLAVFKKLFKQMGHIEHYNMMMGIPHSDEEL